MPTESDLHNAADMLDRAGTSVHAVPSSVGRAFDSRVTTGGRLTLEIDALLAATQMSCSSDGEDLDSLAALCRERAAVIGAYADALGVYSSRMQSYEWAADRWQRNYSDHAQQFCHQTSWISYFPNAVYYGCTYPVAANTWSPQVLGHGE